MLRYYILNKKNPAITLKALTHNFKNVRFFKTETQGVSTGIAVKFPNDFGKQKTYESLFCLFSRYLSKTAFTRKEIDRCFLEKASNSTKFKVIKNEKKYAIIRVYIGFTNLNFSLTTLTGKTLIWVSGGSLENQTRNTRLTSRAVGLLLKDFLIKVPKITSVSLIKVLFTGPSKRFRGKLFSMIKRKAKRLNFSVICKEEGFRVSFNGCRLTRAKR